MAKKKSLTTAEQFYVEQHAKTKSAARIAEELGLPADLVEAERAKHVKKHKMDVAKDGMTVSMTAEESFADDERQKQGRNEDLFGKLKDDIHVIDASKPTK